MGASLLWKPVKSEGVSLPVGGRSSFIDAFREAFGEPPWILTNDESGVLRGLRAAIKERDAFEAIEDAIAKHGSIELWPQY